MPMCHSHVPLAARFYVKTSLSAHVSPYYVGIGFGAYSTMYNYNGNRSEYYCLYLLMTQTLY